MRYNLTKYKARVREYTKVLSESKGKSVLILLHIEDKEAFYALAPLSQALDQVGADVNVQIINKKSQSLDAIMDLWVAFDKKDKTLLEFINKADKKCKGKIKPLFKAPDIYLEAQGNHFIGDFTLNINNDWMTEYRKADLLKTARRIWDHVYNLKKSEKVSIGFELVPSKQSLPLIDYLDSFQIAGAMANAVRDQVAMMGATTSRKSMNDPPERLSELKSTLLGCELCKNVDEPIFKSFRKLSKKFKLDRLKPASAVFGIHGKGYNGKHYFGQNIGYPSLNKKTRWQSPGQMIYKLDFYPQTALDPRDPLARIAFTETIPIDIFIKTCYIDWLAMQKRDKSIMNILEKCDHIIVKGKKFGKFQTDLKIGLVGKNGKRRKLRGSDVATRELIKKSHLKETGIKAGTMANIPGGEAFMTPEYVKGQFIGDVVISLDQSYLIPVSNPFIINCTGNNYKIVKGPKNLVDKFNKKKKDAYNHLKNHEKNKVLPKELIELNKENFNNIGEFAINTNPKAEPCDYLIVNEKIANMIHIALGSGFEPDRATYYHTDIVINAPRQKLNIYGVTKTGKEYHIHKEGKFVI